MAPDPQNSQAMLELRQLTKHYRSVPAVENVNFTLKPGGILGYVGPNGSGKSTTVKMLTGLLEPTSGVIYFQGADIQQDLVNYKKQLGYVPEEPHLYTHLSGLEYLTLTGRLRGLGVAAVTCKAEELLRLFGLHESRHSRMTTYSKGMRQRVLIIGALLANPRLIVLDEPFSGLDVSAALLFRHLLEELAAGGRMVLFSSHVLEVVERLCSDVVILYRGQVVAHDSLVNLRRITDQPSLEEVFAQVTQRVDYATQARSIVSVVEN